ncbi:hypothetical protein PCAR4_80005 [Paraburkholderia caribensis]|nr:hypothetical protein PCAR4_80005 [Paraburkholderia caribensis]
MRCAVVAFAVVAAVVDFTAFARHEHIADAAHRLNAARRSRVVFEQTPQAPHGHVDAALRHFRIRPMQQIDDARARQRFHRMLREHFEQRIFAARQLDGFVVAKERARREVQPEAAEHERLAMLGGGRFGMQLMAAQHGMNAREQFLRHERLAEIVVRAEFEADHAVHAIGARRQHDDGNRVAAGAQLLERRESVDAGHHQVEHDDRRTLALESAREMRGIVQHREFDAALLEEIAKQVAQVGVVVDEQHLDGRVGHDVSRLRRRFAALGGAASLPPGIGCAYDYSATPRGPGSGDLASLTKS